MEELKKEIDISYTMLYCLIKSLRVGDAITVYP